MFLNVRDEVRGEWKRLQNRERERESFVICTLHQILFGRSRRMGWAGHRARKGEERDAYRDLVRTHEERGSLGTSR
jgi:hypothetical protein